MNIMNPEVFITRKSNYFSVDSLFYDTVPLRSKQQKARDFSHGMNASSYQQTRSIISVAQLWL